MSHKRGSVVWIVDSKTKSFLLLQRTKNDFWMPEKYCLPGGKVNKNETFLSAAYRETFEETGLNVYDLIELSKINSFGWEIRYYRASSFEGKVKISSEHASYVWTSLEELNKYDCIPALKELSMEKLNDLL